MILHGFHLSTSSHCLPFIFRHLFIFHSITALCDHMLSKFVVVEVSNSNNTMTLVEYLVTHGFDKFAVVTDLVDHPSFKYKDGSSSPESPSTTASTAAQHTPPRTAVSTPTSINTPVPPHQNKQRHSIDKIAANLSTKKVSPSSIEKQLQRTSHNPLHQLSTPHALSQLQKLLEEQHKINQMNIQKKEQERQQAEIQRILLQQANAAQINHSFGLERLTPEYDDNHHSETISKASSEDLKTEPDSTDFGLGTSDDQVRASMLHLLHPVFAPAFGMLDAENIFGAASKPTTPASKRRNTDSNGAPSKKHRWLPVNELEESRSSRGKNCGRVHCKATYKCALCGKPTTLNSTGSRWNLLRHVIMIHSDCKPYKCWDCDFTGIKSNVISHARQCRHNAEDAHDITTDEMRAEWNLRLHECFPDYVRAKERGWQPEEVTVKKEEVEESPTLVKQELTLVKQEPTFAEQLEPMAQPLV
ncbi:Transcription factor lin-26 [Caenorhabditis elegans]|uniref:Isoform c of Transcription factor lin-26 n=1 Tax=Caenorhabditis elegans TaxID=6239 RepID=Q27355-4|nr:Transcription factor lin-26 [Caenorhabditis elegans]CAA83585.1 transcription factor [Caenorhabditis elegans]CDH93452.1 Transcription factor lin-26 [Caenorhabditis elegans]|eukprot:NP_001293587.1 Transcription factor lin-26 [Caenorhabditis elegans]